MRDLRPAHRVSPWHIAFKEAKPRFMAAEELMQKIGENSLQDIPLTAAHAEELARAFGTSVQLWLGLEARYREQGRE